MVVRITANDRENLLAEIAADRRVKAEEFRGEARLSVTLKSDPGLDVVGQHNDTQTVVRGQRYREWSWSVWPKATGPHQLSLLVQGTAGNHSEDYDPETEQYDVGFNWWYWFSNGFQQYGLGWAFTAALSAITFFLGRRTRHQEK